MKLRCCFETAYPPFPQGLLLRLDLKNFKRYNSRWARSQRAMEGNIVKFTPGPIVAAASGSIGGTTFSHNKGGMYARNRSIPTISTTIEALAAKSRFATESSAWGDLTAAQRDSWGSFALQRPVIDTLGNPRHLSGFQQFVGINSRRALASDARLLVPPIVSAPDGLLTLVLAADIGLGDVNITYTVTPLGATEEIWLLAAVTNSPGITFVQNLYRWVMHSPAAQASPLDIETETVARIGTLTVGQTLFVSVYVYDNASGLLSQPLRDETVVVTT